MGKRYHYNEGGEPGLCAALTGNCPYGETSGHFPTAADARYAYEARMSAQILGHSFQKPRPLPVAEPEQPDFSLGASFQLPPMDNLRRWLGEDKNFGTPAWRARVALDPATEVDIFDTLAEDDSATVLTALVANRRAPYEAIERILERTRYDEIFDDDADDPQPVDTTYLSWAAEAELNSRNQRIESKAYNWGWGNSDWRLKKLMFADHV